MKKYFLVLCVLAAALLTAACAEGKASQPAKQESKMEQEQTAELPNISVQTVAPVDRIPEAEGLVPTFLTPEQQALYRRAKTAFMEFQLENTGFGSTWKEEKVYEYYSICDGPIKTWADFEEAMCALFTPEYYRQLNDNEGFPIFKEYQGQLCFSGGARGGDITFMGEETFELISETPEEIQFYLVGNYSDFVKQPDGTWAHDKEKIVQEKKLMVLQNTEAGWRFSQFALAF